MPLAAQSLRRAVELKPELTREAIFAAIALSLSGDADAPAALDKVRQNITPADLKVAQDALKTLRERHPEAAALEALQMRFAR